MDLKTVNEVIDSIKLQIAIRECSKANSDMLQKYLKVALYAKGKIKLDNQKKKGKLGVNDSSLKEKEKKI